MKIFLILMITSAAFAQEQPIAKPDGKPAVIIDSREALAGSPVFTSSFLTAGAVNFWGCYITLQGQ